MNDIVKTIADHPKLSDESKQRLIALALVLESIERQVVLKQEELKYD